MRGRKARGEYVRGKNGWVIVRGERMGYKVRERKHWLKEGEKNIREKRMSPSQNILFELNIMESRLVYNFILKKTEDLQQT